VFSGLAFHPPTPAVEQLYMSSFTIERCALRNSNTGSNNPTTTLTPVRSPEQLLMDSLNETYAKLLDKTSGKPIPDVLRRDLLSYYADLEKPFANKQNSKAWHKVIKELDTLKSTPMIGISLPTDSCNFPVSSGKA
jgi:hypothetical protein